MSSSNGIEPYDSNHNSFITITNFNCNFKNVTLDKVNAVIAYKQMVSFIFQSRVPLDQNNMLGEKDLNPEYKNI